MLIFKLLATHLVDEFHLFEDGRLAGLASTEKLVERGRVSMLSHKESKRRARRAEKRRVDHKEGDHGARERAGGRYPASLPPAGPSHSSGRRTSILISFLVKGKQEVGFNSKISCLKGRERDEPELHLVLLELVLDGIVALRGLRVASLRFGSTTAHVCLCVFGKC